MISGVISPDILFSVLPANIKTTTAEIKMSAVGFDTSLSGTTTEASYWDDTYDSWEGIQYVRPDQIDGKSVHIYSFTTTQRFGYLYRYKAYGTVTYVWNGDSSLTGKTLEKTYSGLTAGKAYTKTNSVQSRISYTEYQYENYFTQTDTTYYYSETQLSSPLTWQKITQYCTYWKSGDTYYSPEAGYYTTKYNPDELSTYTTTLETISKDVTFYTQGNSFSFGAVANTSKIHEVLKASNVASWAKACAAKRSWLKQDDHYDWCDDCSTVSGRVTADWYNKCRNCVASISADSRATSSYVTADSTRITAALINALNISYS